MKKPIKFLLLVPVFLFTVLLFSCTKINNGEKTNILKPNHSTEFNVIFYAEDEEIKTVKVSDNQTLQKIEAPEKDGYLFDNWYTENDFRTLFDFNGKITKHTKLYARYISFKEYFLKARNNTVQSDSFKYNYKLSLENSFEYKKNIPLPGAFYQGTTYYNKNNDIKYLRDEITSGLLLTNKHNYHFLKDNKLHKVSFKHNTKTKIDTDPKERVNENYTKPYEYSIYAKALFKFDEDKIKSVIRENKDFVISFNESQLDIIKESLLSYSNEELNKIANGLKKESIRSVKAVVTFDFEKQQIKKFRYCFDFSLPIEKKVKIVNVKGNFVSKLNYELEFDNNFDKNIPIAQQIKNFVK